MIHLEQILSLSLRCIFACVIILTPLTFFCLYLKRRTEEINQLKKRLSQIESDFYVTNKRLSEKYEFLHNRLTALTRKIESPKVTKQEYKQIILKARIKDSSLSPAVKKALANANINTFEDIVKLEPGDAVNMKHLVDAGGIEEIGKLFERFGLKYPPIKPHSRRKKKK